MSEQLNWQSTSFIRNRLQVRLLLQTPNDRALTATFYTKYYNRKSGFGRAFESVLSFIGSQLYYLTTLLHRRRLQSRVCFFKVSAYSRPPQSFTHTKTTETQSGPWFPFLLYFFYQDRRVGDRGFSSGIGGRSYLITMSRPPSTQRKY